MFGFFPRHQCLILKSDELRDDQRTTVRTIYKFLGVVADDLPEPTIANKGEYAPMPGMVRKTLTMLYWREIGRLENLLGWDCQDWVE